MSSSTAASSSHITRTGDGPKRTARPAKAAAPASSAPRQSAGMGAPQWRHLPRQSRKLTTGIRSRADSSRPQAPHRERPRGIQPAPAARRAAAQSKKLPSTAPSTPIQRARYSVSSVSGFMGCSFLSLGGGGAAFLFAAPSDEGAGSRRLTEGGTKAAPHLFVAPPPLVGELAGREAARLKGTAPGFDGAVLSPSAAYDGTSSRPKSRRFAAVGLETRLRAQPRRGRHEISKSE